MQQKSADKQLSADLYGVMSEMKQGFFQLCQCSRGICVEQLNVGAGEKTYGIGMALQYLAAAALGKVQKLVKIIPPEQHGASGSVAAACPPNGVRVGQKQQRRKAFGAEKGLITGQKQAGLQLRALLQKGRQPQTYSVAAVWLTVQQHRTLERIAERLHSGVTGHRSIRCKQTGTRQSDGAVYQGLPAEIRQQLVATEAPPQPRCHDHAADGRVGGVQIQ